MRDEAAESIISKLLEEHGLTGDTRLFREAKRESLLSTDKQGSDRLTAYETPGESVIDVIEVARAWYFTLPNGSIEVRAVE